MYLNDGNGNFNLSEIQDDIDLFGLRQLDDDINLEQFMRQTNMIQDIWGWKMNLKLFLLITILFKINI